MQCVCAATEDSEGVVDEIRAASRTSWLGQGAGAWPGGVGPQQGSPSGWSRGGSERELGKQPGQFVKGKARAQDV